MSLLAMLPSPIVYGAIIDKSCILWQKVTSALMNDRGAFTWISKGHLTPQKPRSEIFLDAIAMLDV